MVISITNSRGSAGDEAISAANIPASGDLAEVVETPIPSPTTSAEPVFWERVAAEMVQVCTVITENDTSILLADRLGSGQRVSVVGAAYRVSDDGCIRHPPPIEIARQHGPGLDENEPYWHVSCWLWLRQTEPDIEGLVVSVELYHGPDSTDESGLHRIVEAPDDRIVFADCGVAVPKVNRFDNESTRRWLPADSARSPVYPASSP